MSLVGKFGASACFAIVFVYTAEMYPTPIRNQAVGICSLVGRIGGIVTLLLDLLKVYWLPAPVFIMGVAATTAGALAVFFPETLGQKLPGTIDEALRYGFSFWTPPRVRVQLLDLLIILSVQNWRKQQQRILHFYLLFSKGSV